ESLNRYVVALLRTTRSDERLYLGGSPRAGIALLRVAKARALADGREYLSPDDVKAVAAPVLAHRLIVAPEARPIGLSAAECGALEAAPVPVCRAAAVPSSRSASSSTRPPGSSARNRSTRLRSACSPSRCCRGSGSGSPKGRFASTGGHARATCTRERTSRCA